jgi:site-specific DNA-methyltransferase (adenine-specific)
MSHGGVFRKRLVGTVGENLRRWKTGGLQRLSAVSPLPDVIRCQRTPTLERQIANHPNIKPQAFLRQIVKASLPLGEGIVLDPFMGSGSTIAAADFLGYRAIGIELDSEYFKLAKRAVPQLANLYLEDKQPSFSFAV